MEFIILMIIGATIYYFVQNSKKGNLRKNLDSTKRADQRISNTKQTVQNTKSEYSQKIASNSFHSNSIKKTQPTSINKPSEAVSKSPSFSFNSSRDNEDESLITITISSGRTEQISSNKALGRWIQPGEIIKIKHFETKSGLFYFGGELSAYQGNSYYNHNQTEASLVDDSLPIINKDQFFTDDSLDYWPRYIELSPSARGAYLNWLCSDRDHPETPIGYVFIYFYGLERRILVDGTQGKLDDREYIFIFNELKRLRKVFNENYAFLNYASKLIDLIAYLKPDIIQLDDAELEVVPHV